MTTGILDFDNAGGVLLLCSFRVAADRRKHSQSGGKKKEKRKKKGTHQSLAGQGTGAEWWCSGQEQGQ